VTAEGDALSQLEGQLAAVAEAQYSLLLFVTGTSDLSMRAIRNVRALCEEQLANRYELQVIDVNRDPSLMSSYDVVAAPTLIKVLPLPSRMLVGDLSDRARVLSALDIQPAAEPRGGLDR
jgi:circadian clock protein KaiB